MTKDNLSLELKREAIRSKVVEVIPEILEKKFGCNITIDNITYTMVDSTSFLTTGGFNGQDFDDGGCEMISEYETWGAVIKIIGRPILAQDIVKTLGQFYLLSGKGDLLEHAGFVSDSMREHKFNTICRINLSQNLSEWESKTVDQLYKLMCENI